MNKTYLFSIFALILSFFSCDKIDDLTKFNIEYNEEVIIESSTVVDLPISVSTPEISTNSTETFENNNTSKDLIESIKLTSMTLQITDPDDGNFNFLNAINIYISAENQEETLIAWKDEIAEDSSQTLELDTTNEDLKNYIKEDEFSLRIETTTDQVITNDHHINVNSNFFVDAKILGI